MRMAWLVIFLLSLSAEASTGRGETCQAALTPTENAYFRLLRKAEQENLISEEQLQKLQSGESLNPLSGQTLPAPFLFLQQGLETYGRKMNLSSTIQNQLKAFADEFRKRRSATTDAIALTRSVPLPQEEPLVPNETFVDGPTQFFWFKDSAGAPFLGVEQSASSRLRMISLTAPHENLIREPETLFRGQHLLKSSFFVHQDHLKIVYASPRQEKLVLYDLQTDLRITQELKGIVPLQLEVRGRFLIVVHAKGISLYELEPAFRQVTQLDQPLSHVQIVSPAADRIWVTGSEGRTAYVFEPLRQTQPLREWSFEHSILNLAVDSDEAGDPLGAAQIEGQGTYLLKQGRGPKLNSDVSATARLFWHRTEDGRHWLVFLSASTSMLANADQADQPILKLGGGRTVTNVKWLRNASQDFVGLVEPLNAKAARVTVSQIEGFPARLREIAAGTSLIGSGHFLFLDHLGQWLYQVQSEDQYFFSDLLPKHEVVFVKKNVRAYSPPFEVDPGHWLAATVRNGQLTLIHLTRPL